jgi:hypothetical protein
MEECLVSVAGIATGEIRRELDHQEHIGEPVEGFSGSSLSPCAQVPATTPGGPTISYGPSRVPANSIICTRAVTEVLIVNGSRPLRKVVQLSRSQPVVQYFRSDYRQISTLMSHSCWSVALRRDPS